MEATQRLLFSITKNEITKDSVHEFGLGNAKANMNVLFLQRPITRWPFFVFLGGAMFCLLASTTCHLLGCLSSRAFYALLRVDYAGISTLIAASFYPPVCFPLAILHRWNLTSLLWLDNHVVAITGVNTHRFRVKF